MRNTLQAGGFIAAYICCDVLSGPEARFQTIAPVWHPAAGLALYCVLQHGQRAALRLAVAALLAAAITPALPGRPDLSLLIGLLPVPIYLAVGMFTRRHLPGSEFIGSHRALLLWAGAITLGSMVSAMLYSTFMEAEWHDGVTRYAIAETAGMLVTAPAAYCLLKRELRADFLARVASWDSVAYVSLMAILLALALQQPADEPLMYYLLILPLAWSAARQGMAGAMTAAIVLEAGVTIASLRPVARAAQIPDVQMLVLALTLSGFLIGIAVDVARRASHELRDSLRLAAAGEMAAAVAHELNQPLTALSAYGSACQRLLQRGGGDPLLQKTIDAMAAESERASNVLKRLRDFFRTESTMLEDISLPALIHDTVGYFTDQASADNVRLQVNHIPDARLLGDRVQLEIVLRNLLSNAVQALAQMPGGTDRLITVDAGVEEACIWIRIADNGPGIAEKIRARLFEPFVSLKSSGLGLGLAISRSIVEAHGGSLTVESSRHAVLKITLPAQRPGMDQQ